MTHCWWRQLGTKRVGSREFVETFENAGLRIGDQLIMLEEILGLNKLVSSLEFPQVPKPFLDCRNLPHQHVDVARSMLC